MKRNIKNSLLILTVATLLVRCQKVDVDTNLVDTYVEFASDNLTVGYSKTVNLNFAYIDANATNDTIWLPIQTKGLINTETRQISLKPFREDALLAGVEHAVEGVNYVAFDDVSLKPLLKLDAGSIIGTIPIVIKRAVTAKNRTLQLTAEIVDGENLKAGTVTNRKIKIIIADGLSKPSRWSSKPYIDGAYVDFELDLFGGYGPVKHDFLIRTTGQKFDDTYLNIISSDAGLYYYYKARLKHLLAEENAKRKTQGLADLIEDPANPYSIVTFP